MHESIRFLWWWDQYLAYEEEGDGNGEGGEREVGCHRYFLH